MMDSLILPFNDSQSLVISTDNSGGIGLKEKDLVHVPYEVVGYYSFRVAVMECLASGGSPIAVVLQNFCGDEAWGSLTKGVRKGMDEIGLDLSITGSTESNMPLQQSALGLMVIGKREKGLGSKETSNRKMAIVGRPLVGDEVIEQQQWVAPLSLFKWCSELEGVRLLPVGSKGIAYEWEQLDPQGGGIPERIKGRVDIEKSSGPSTSFLITYPESLEADIFQRCGPLILV